jgi:hypothetical protein
LNQERLKSPPKIRMKLKHFPKNLEIHRLENLNRRLNLRWGRARS